jgi:hypothetical protein
MFCDCFDCVTVWMTGFLLHNDPEYKYYRRTHVLVMYGAITDTQRKIRVVRSRLSGIVNGKYRTRSRDRRKWLRGGEVRSLWGYFRTYGQIRWESQVQLQLQIEDVRKRVTLVRSPKQSYFRRFACARTPLDSFLKTANRILERVRLDYASQAPHCCI